MAYGLRDGRAKLNLTAMLDFLKKYRSQAALAIAVLCCLQMSRRELLMPSLTDFHTYRTAAQIVRMHESRHLYEDADTGQDPQLLPAPPAHLFAQTARSDGIQAVRMYLYPPALADALVPLAGLSLRNAGLAWYAASVLALLAVAAILISWFQINPLSWTSLGIALCLLLFRPDMSGLRLGQVTCILLLLWTLGIFLYVKGHVRAAALVLAVAVCIKLTPLIVLLPMLLWREWKWLKWFVIATAGLAAAMCAINGPATLTDFVVHVMPAMSRGIPSPMNNSVQSAVQVAYLDLTGRDVAQLFLPPVPSGVTTLAKLLSLLVIAAVMVQVYRLGVPKDGMERAKVLALVALLSACTAPVAWKHAYSVAFLALFLLWRETLTRKTTGVELGLLTFATVECSFYFDQAALKIVKAYGMTHGPLLVMMPLLAPLTGIVLVFFTLHKMRCQRSQPQS
jgi:hypothetical protein